MVFKNENGFPKRLHTLSCLLKIDFQNKVSYCLKHEEKICQKGKKNKLECPLNCFFFFLIVYFSFRMPGLL